MIEKKEERKKKKELSVRGRRCEPEVRSVTAMLSLLLVIEKDVRGRKE